MILRNSRFAQTILLTLCLMPLLLFAYLGSHARMMADDYCHVDVASDRGLLQSVTYWRNRWNGGYTYYLVLGMLAPLGAAAPAVFPAITIFLWFAALSALIYQVLPLVRLNQVPRLTAAATGAIIVALSVNAFFSPQSLYYYAGSARHTLPIAGLTAYFALFAAVCRRRHTTQSAARLLAITGGVLCFINAGLGETLALFQLMCIGSFCLVSILLVKRSVSWRCNLFLLAGLLATAASLIVMATAPGTAIRKSLLDAITAQQNRDFFSLALMSLEMALHHLRDPELIKGFVAVFGLAMFLTLDGQEPATAATKLPPSVGLARLPLLFALAHQLLCLIMLLEQVSADPKVLGRYSIGYSIVLLVNLGLVIGIACLLALRQRAERLPSSPRGSAHSLGPLFLIATMLAAAAAQIRGVDWRVSTYLYLTLLALLISLSWQWSYSLPRSITRPAWIAIITAYALSFFGSLLIIFFGNYIGGSVWLRILSFVPYVFILPGLIWAAFLGRALFCLRQSSRASAAATLGLKLFSLIVAMVICADAFLEQARLVPSFQQYALEWGAREQQIKYAREHDQKTVTVAPLSFDLESYVGIDKLHKTGCPLQYYNLDAILLQDR